MRLKKSLTSLALINLAIPANADNWTVTPFALYEEAQDQIVVDGVSTNYGLGVFGAQITYGADQNLSLSARAGFGQNNHQEVSFSGAKFTGKVTGTYLEASATTNLLTYSKSIVSLEGSYSKRDLKADDLIGSRNGLALTGNSISSIASTDILVNLRHSMTDKVTMSASLGYGTWTMNADATAYFSSGSISANANKKINTTGYDPIYKLGINYEGERANISANISNRSLRSKSNTAITSGEVVVNFKF